MCQRDSGRLFLMDALLGSVPRLQDVKRSQSYKSFSRPELPESPRGLDPGFAGTLWLPIQDRFVRKL